VAPAELVLQARVGTLGARAHAVASRIGGLERLLISSTAVALDQWDVPKRSAVLLDLQAAVRRVHHVEQVRQPLRADQRHWTEKLADPLLTHMFPIHHGCPNVHEYFGPGAVGVIDIDDPECAIARIRTLMVLPRLHGECGGTTLGRRPRRGPSGSTRSERSGSPDRRWSLACTV
jgi:hypothetical protein